ncbi:TIGR01666 family membrane protein, partial [Bacillus stratosphericus]
MRTPAVNPKIIATLPVFFSVLIATVFILYFNVPKLTTPFVLGIIAGGLVDLDNRLTGRLINIVITVVLFSIASLSAQITYGSGLPFILAMTLLTLVFT